MYDFSLQAFSTIFTPNILFFSFKILHVTDYKLNDIKCAARGVEIVPRSVTYLNRKAHFQVKIEPIVR